MKNFRRTPTVTNLTWPHCTSNVGLLLQINITKGMNAVSTLIYATRHDDSGSRSISPRILNLGTWSDSSTSRPGRTNPRGNTPPVLTEEKARCTPQVIRKQRTKCVLVGNATKFPRSSNVLPSH